MHNTTPLPVSLKGIDMIIFSVFRSLGLHVQVHPILNNQDGYLAKVIENDWDNKVYNEPENSDDEDGNERGFEDAMNTDFVGRGFHEVILDVNSGYDVPNELEVISSLFSYLFFFFVSFTICYLFFYPYN